MSRLDKMMSAHKRILITGFQYPSGAANGIGRYLTLYFLRKGHQVCGIDIDETSLDKLKREIFTDSEIQPAKSLLLKCDVSSEPQIVHTFQTVATQFDGLDGLVNNAGLTRAQFKSEKLEDVELSEWQRYLDVNLTGPFLMCKHAAPFLRKSKGSIINMSSTRALMSEPRSEGYAATKAGLVGLTHSLAMSLGPDVRVNCVSPGWIDTRDEVEATPPPLTEADHKQHPVGRVGVPDDVARLVNFLICDEGGFMTGQNIVLDGGQCCYLLHFWLTPTTLSRHDEEDDLRGLDVNSVTHPINVSWLFPSNTATLLKSCPPKSDLLDALGSISGSSGPTDEILSKRKAIGKSVESCQGQKVCEDQERNGGREEEELAEAAAVDVMDESWDSLGGAVTETVFEGIGGVEQIPASLDEGLVNLLRAAGYSNALLHGHHQGNFAMSSCPGKKVRLDSGPVNGRAVINRDLDADFARMASLDIRTVVNCLFDPELSYLGASYNLYEEAATKHGIKVLRLPMMEGSCPEAFDELDKVVVEICSTIESGGYILCHCRGGIGRAGLVACCFLLRTGLCRDPERAIRLVRLRRSPKAIETRRQEDYISAYHIWLKDGRPPNRTMGVNGPISQSKVVLNKVSASWGPASLSPRSLSS
ncbi:hypothetical protein SmJEL517_g00051 [Synchytrium microbalum]|uniref:Tyrosine specific protein phosphatases domain-containing protein n=1 Tax=Synchytrium microbalum TaxID=1806994 RepID=A0A507CKB3_9FUNG|nr:uncharacterized protein SmJEL517_g00051 [Synchytrium microbalum]TPX38263.1 hypothetical protein SmJEL517_g00051 [Synchytrium microbalum]